MNLEKGVISGSQLTFLIAIYLLGSLYRVATVFRVTHRDVWLAVLTAFLLFILFALVYAKLMQKFPGKNLIQLNDIVYGRYLGKVFSLLYIVFFILMATSNFRFLSDFIVQNYMLETPLIVIAIMFLFVSAWLVRSGIEVLTRVGFICFIIIFIFSVFSLTSFIISGIFELNNFLPVLNIPLMDFVQANHVIISLFYGEVFIFMMLIPYVDQIKKVNKSIFLGTAMGAAGLFTSVVLITGVLGEYASVTNNPLNTTIRQVEIGAFLTRLEFIIASSMMVSMFMKISVIYYATSLGISQLLKLKSYKALVLPIGIIFLGLVIPIFDNPFTQVEIELNTRPFFAVIFQFVLPLITLVIAAIRGLPKKQGGEG